MSEAVNEDQEIKKDYLYKESNLDPVLKDKDVAHLVINHNKVDSENSLPGLDVKTKELEDGVDVTITLQEGVNIEKPVHLCFGVLHQSAVQKIYMNVDIKKDASISVLAHCMFPIGKEVEHIMKGNIIVRENAKFQYFEKHIHSPFGGVKVYPHAKVKLEKGAEYKTEFELIKGRVGLLDIDYTATCEEDSVLDMMARVAGREDDQINIREIGHLNGKNARGVLTSRVAVRGKAKADVYNELIANAPYAHGHVDCQEILKDEGTVKAVPVVEVNDPKAHITHEAALGGVDNKQLESLMARGLDEEEATELIIQGILSRKKR